MVKNAAGPSRALKVSPTKLQSSAMKVDGVLTVKNAAGPSRALKISPTKLQSGDMKVHRAGNPVSVV